jgi:hypothetical protein
MKNFLRYGKQDNTAIRLTILQAQEHGLQDFPGKSNQITDRAAL